MFVKNLHLNIHVFFVLYRISKFYILNGKEEYKLCQFTNVCSISSVQNVQNHKSNAFLQAKLHI